MALIPRSPGPQTGDDTSLAGSLVLNRFRQVRRLNSAVDQYASRVRRQRDRGAPGPVEIFGGVGQLHCDGRQARVDQDSGSSCES
jgi:hypothetical protein